MYLELWKAYKNREKNSSRERKAGILDKITFELGLKGLSISESLWARERFNHGRKHEQKYKITHSNTLYLQVQAVYCEWLTRSCCLCGIQVMGKRDHKYSKNWTNQATQKCLKGNNPCVSVLVNLGGRGQYDTSLFSVKNLNWENVSIRLSYGQSCKVFAWLMVNIRGPSPLQVVTPLNRWSNTV